jgi:uncharacterized protein YlaI
MSKPEGVEMSRRLKEIMPVDKYGDEKGEYIIRSVYFDNWYNTALREKINGYDDRKKYRIRLYNGNPNYICFECKQRIYGMTKKTSARISHDQCVQMLEGDTKWMLDAGTPFLAQAYSHLKKGYHPKTIIEYTRQAFVYSAGHVRITIDKDIRRSTYISAFMEKTTPTVSVPLDCWAVFEVKYDGFMPLHIRNAVQTGRLFQQAYSKYANGRIYG